MKLLLPLTITAAVIACGYVAYRRHKRKFILSDELDSSEIQRISDLKIEKLLDWVNTLDFGSDENSEFELNVLPNEATLKSFNQELNIPKKDLANCYLIVVLQPESNQIIARKLVITKQLGDEFAVLSQNKVFAIKIK